MDERGMEPVRSGLDAESIRVTLEALGDGGPAR
jgi:hypothetical protein